MFQIRLPDKDEDAILHIEAQTDESREKPMALRVLIIPVFLPTSMRRMSILQFSNLRDAETQDSMRMETM